MRKPQTQGNPSCFFGARGLVVALKHKFCQHRMSVGSVPMFPESYVPRFVWNQGT